MNYEIDSYHYDLTKNEVDDISQSCVGIIVMGSPPTMILNYLQSIVEFPSKKFVEELMAEVTNLQNNTHMWILKGHTPKVVFEEEKKHLLPLSEKHYKTDRQESNVVNMSNYKKIGRNAPCSCGSGIKYKKCCLKK
ncbi:YecA family protein [Salipaludibacillus sp. HK11]|uniref:YecA family protein n=1 Tax=Salipaludibacillus sp. HK11 TaxID=3394320 RepID=UPI0039FBC0D4